MVEAASGRLLLPGMLSVLVHLIPHVQALVPAQADEDAVTGEKKGHAIVGDDGRKPSSVSICSLRDKPKHTRSINPYHGSNTPARMTTKIAVGNSMLQADGPERPSATRRPHLGASWRLLLDQAFMSFQRLAT